MSAMVTIRLHNVGGFPTLVFAQHQKLHLRNGDRTIRAADVLAGDWIADCCTIGSSNADGSRTIPEHRRKRTNGGAA